MKALHKLAIFSAACMILNCAAPLISVLPAAAAEEDAVQTSGICGEDLERGTKISWELDTATGTLTISGYGHMYNYQEDFEPTGKLGYLSKLDGYFDREEPAPWGKNIKKVVMGFGITSVGSYAFSGCKELESVTLSKSTEQIECFAFSNSGLKEITFLKNITSVNDCAFYGCDALETVNFEGAPTYIGSYGFSGCTALKAIKLPVFLSTLEEGAFSGCTSLADIHLPFTLNTIGSQAFAGTPWLETQFSKSPYFVFNEKLVAADPSLKGDITLPEGFDSIGEGAFESNQGITSVTLPENITTIGSRAFSNCTGLKSVTIPGSISVISDQAFSGCTALESIAFPHHLFSIDQDAFRNCSSLTEVTLPEECRYIWAGAFADCASLKKVTLLDPEVQFDEGLVDNPVFISNQDGQYTGTIVGYDGSTAQEFAEKTGCKFESLGKMPSEQPPTDSCGKNLKWKLDEDGTLTISGTGEMKDYFDYKRSGSLYAYISTAPWGDAVKAVVIEEGVTSIGSAAFLYCHDLKSVSLPESLTNIGDYAFDECDSLSEIRFPDGVETIGALAFNGTALTEPVLPKQLKYLGEQAFQYCFSLTAIVIPEGTEYLGRAAFQNCESLASVKLPDSLTYVGAYAFAQTLWLYEKTAEEDLVIENGVLLKVNEDVSGDIVVPEGVKVIAGGAFDLIGYYHEVDAPRPEMKISLPEGVVAICDNAFVWCGMKTINLPSTLTDIYDSAFFNCFSLENVTLPEKLKTIGADAFGNCENLKEIVIPESVETIGIDAFVNCENLESVTILNPKTKIGDEPTTFTNPKQLFDHLTFTGVIYGFADSTAEAYADRYYRKFELIGKDATASAQLKGDVTCDENIDISDAVALARLVAEDTSVQISAAGMKNADVNKSGCPDSDDVVMILKYIAKLIPSFE